MIPVCFKLSVILIPCDHEGFKRLILSHLKSMTNLLMELMLFTYWTGGSTETTNHLVQCSSQTGHSEAAAHHSIIDCKPPLINYTFGTTQNLDTDSLKAVLHKKPPSEDTEVVALLNIFALPYISSHWTLHCIQPPLLFMHMSQSFAPSIYTVYIQYSRVHILPCAVNLLFQILYSKLSLYLYLSRFYIFHINWAPLYFFIFITLHLWYFHYTFICLISSCKVSKPKNTLFQF